MGVTAKEFRRKSAACKTASILEGNQDKKRQLLDLAQAWLQLAEHTERHPDWQAQFVISDHQLTERSQVLTSTSSRRVSPDFRLKLVYSAENPRMM